MCSLCITVDHVTVPALLWSLRGAQSFSLMRDLQILFLFCLVLTHFPCVLEPTSSCRNSTVTKLCTAVLQFTGRTGSFLPIGQIGGGGSFPRGFSGSWKQSALHVSIFHSFSALIRFSCWLLFIIINMITVMIIIAAAAAPLWLL